MPIPKTCSGIPQRWIIVLACFLCLFNSYEMQICLSVAIIKMVVPKNNTIKLDKNETCTSDAIDVLSFYNKSITSKGMTFDWDEKTQGYIFSAWYWGSISAYILGSLILDKLGAKRTMRGGVLLISLFTLLVPKSVEWYGAVSLTVLRYLAGFGAGMMHPAMMRLFSRWIPDDERSFAASWAYAGASLGSIVGMAASGAMIEKFDSGWPAVFYVYGGFGIFVCFIHCAICYDSPNEHPCISESEVEMLKRKLQHSHVDLPPTPWNQIIRSKPIWAILIALSGNIWCQITMANYTPKFMSSVLKFNLDTSGYISSIPHIGSLVLSCVLSRIGDQLIAKNVVSTACVRKIGNTIATVVTGLLLVTVTYIGRNPTLVVGLYVLATILLSCHHISTLVNILDLTPNYAGAIQGIILAVSASIGSMSPYVAGWLMPTQTIDEWRSVFFVVLLVGAATNLIFIIFGKAEVQKWNDPKILKSDRVTDNSELFAML